MMHAIGIGPGDPAYMTRRGAERRWEGRLADCPDGFSDMSIMLIRSLDPVASAI